MSDDKTLKLWDASTGALRQTLTGSEKLESVAFSPDAKILASAGYDVNVKLCYAQTGVLKQTYKGHKNNVLSVAFSPDGKTLASSSSDRTVKLWQVQ